MSKNKESKTGEIVFEGLTTKQVEDHGGFVEQGLSLADVLEADEPIQGGEYVVAH